MKSTIIQGNDYIQSLIRSKWVPEIIHGLALDNDRFSELKRHIDEIGDTELKRKLRNLVLAGVVNKTGEGHQIRYYLTPFGYELEHLFAHIRDIGVRYVNGYTSEPSSVQPY